jgi:2-amino-4-hydroxy-6-hydroxymethyldihydropteridine diphosphokinase
MNTEKFHIVYISVGSNLGDRLENCRQALAALNASGTVIVESISRYYFTEPMDYADQPWFVNAAARIRTRLEPAALLLELKSMEAAYGRENTGVRFGPRPLDFDIIFFSDRVIDTVNLVVPHPRMQYREFVLRPLCDLAPELMHPLLQKTMRELLDDLESPVKGCLPVAALVN